MRGGKDIDIKKMLVRLNHVNHSEKVFNSVLHNALPFLKILCFDKQRVWFGMFSQTAQPLVSCVVVKSSLNQFIKCIYIAPFIYKMHPEVLNRNKNNED